MAPSILVTGAAGFVGRHLLQLLQADGAPLTAWHRPGTRPPASLPAHVRWHEVELTDRRSVRAAVAACRPAAVYHCAGAAHVGHAWRDGAGPLAVNALGTHHLLDAARELTPAARILLPGSALVYAAADRPLTEDDPVVPASPYGFSKLAQELIGRDAARNDGAHVLLTRSFNHTGPGQDPSFAASSFARQIAAIEAGRAAPVILVGNLAARRDLTDVRDVARAYRTVLQHGVPGRPYNVCSGRSIAVREILDGLLAMTRVSIELRTDPSLLRPNDARLLVGDPTRIRTELGWSPTVPLTHTLSDLLDHWRRATS